MPQTWFITGASSGLGTSIALAALRAGHAVVATARNIPAAKANHPDVEKLGGIWFQLDVTQPDCEAIVREAVAKHNIDVIVNNAGYGVRGALEDLSFDSIRAQMDTNFFGALAVTRGALPLLRERRAGVVVNISSTAGMMGNPGSSMYCASKWALEAVSESLAQEVSPWGIRVLIVQPGHFRTNFQAVVDVASVSDGYRDSAADQATKKLWAMHGKQEGDPDLAAKAIVEVVDGTGRGADPEVAQCLRLPLGRDAPPRAEAKFESYMREVNLTRGIAEATVYES